MANKIDHLKHPDHSRLPGFLMSEELKNIRVPGQTCDTMPKVQCPVSSGTYCVYDITEVMPEEIDYKCPACGTMVKKDVLTTSGWKTLVLDMRHME